MINVQEIFDSFPKKMSLSDSDKNWISKSFDYAKNAHEGQKRASGEPYFNHVFAVAKKIAELGMDTKSVMAGLLHDSIEDGHVTEKEMDEEFGKEILFLVNGVSKLGKLKYHGRERHVESLRKFFVAMAEDVRVIVIKLADRLHNVSTLKHLPHQKAQRIALETIEIHAPLANRLGMWKLKGELEDLAFPFAFPEKAKDVAKLLKHKSKTDQKSLEQIYKSLQKELVKQGIRAININYRIKGLYSLYKKLQKTDMNIDNIFDLVALRIIVPTVEDCYRVLGVIHGSWTPIPGRIKDFIALPKPNGYKSLHTTIFTGNGAIAEIQIRTPEMHEQAEYGIASYFAYKENLFQKNKRNNDAKLDWIEQFKELQKNVSNPENFLKNLKIDFFSKRIFVFTPKGDVIDLPEGSNPIDFAYSVHSEIGNHTKGAKINGKFTSIYTELKNGDIVEIETNKNTTPTGKWLDATKTTLAKKHIKKYLDENGLLNRFIKKFK